MHSSSTRGRLLAIVAGLAFAAGGLTILLDKDLIHPVAWTSNHWLTILTVFGTIAAGHLMVDATRARHVFATIGFLALFLSGTGLVVYSSVGRQVDSAGSLSLSVEDTNKKIVEKSADLESAKQRKAYAEQQVQNTMTHSYCGRGCKDWQQNAKDVSATIEKLEGEIKALGPQKPINAQASAMADIAALMGYANKDRTIAVLMLLIPFSKTIFFEIGSIVSLGFAFRHSATVRSVQPSVRVEPAHDLFAQSDFPSLSDTQTASIVPLFRDAESEPFDPNGNGPSKRPRRYRRDEALADLQDRIERRESFPSQRELARTFGVPTSTLSEWFDLWEGEGQLIPRRSEGRRKIVG